MISRQIVFSKHAIEQMFSRSITFKDVKEVINSGEIIKHYPDDTPFPSDLMMKFVDLRPIHVVVAKNDREENIIITAYIPDKSLWSDDYKRKVNL